MSYNKTEQSIAEGVEEITAKEYLQNKYPQMRGHLWNSNEYINDDWIAEMMEGFATLHAQRIAEKMVEEKLKKEYEHGIEDGKIIGKHGSVSYIE